MSRYRVEFTSSAARAIRKLPKNVRTRLLDAVAALADEPRPPGARKLAGAEIAWRVRAGDYWVIYEIEDLALLVTVVRAAHRREVYR
ncbi:type II toxin-antitoxin system RelE/ParE family toxin [Curtobacterium sp. SGAir0471]|uniref:type II toxin-antitoxin system RelE family toxin n=1 Tax=Curtobacterium sp. SGAir0471 TaxID=2070337 RepID=UPI0010CD4FD5|nr:type II toxin-antitoxin system RelE/ParE family toxin [Curtobacterium sp. SGAir0471]QCR43355.1 type II toxin-antitoxin system RelE/ParE family toxin [Curtobacterium sp. SGAir0471]